MKHISTRQLALCAVLTALALGLSTLENLFPVTLLIPLPGVKLGLANIVTVFALYQLGALPALAILTARCLLGGLFAGNASAMLFSLLGGLTAMLVMILLRRLRCLSIYGVSIGGAAARAFSSQGQTRTAAISLKLAERELFRADTGEEPVLLLDDVLSELDARRQDFVLNQIRSGQVLITCCEPERITNIGKRIFVESGQIREESSCI